MRSSSSARGTDGTAWTENAPKRGLVLLDLRELWRVRSLVLAFVQRDLRVRYKQALLGSAWAVIQPLLAVAAFTVVFRKVADVPSDGIPYPLFAFAGLTLWTCFTSAVSRASTSLLADVSLIDKVYFPRAAALLAAVLSPLVGLAIALVALAVMSLAYGRVPGPEVLVAPLCVLAVPLTAFGAALVLAPLNLRFRDVQNGLPALLQLGLFVTPVAYPSSVFEGPVRYVVALNPMSGILDTFRWSVLDGPAPGLPLLVSAAVMLLVLLTGLLVFGRNEPTFADVI